MRDAAGLADALERVAAGLADALAGAAPGWLALGVALHLANQVARGRGWFAVLRRACPGDARLRRRDAIAAWVAGAGMGGVLSARGGDAVRLVVVRRRLAGVGYQLLAGTLVAEAVGDAVIGLAVAVPVVAGGLGRAPSLSTMIIMSVLATAIVAGGTLASRGGPLRPFVSGVAHGCAALGDPRAFARAVTPWQLASRLLRVASLACFLIAFGLPATPAAILLVMIAQSGGRLVPFAPAGAAAGVAILAAGFPRATGAHPGIGAVTGFLVGTSVLLTLTGVVLAAGVALRMGGPGGLRAAIRPA